MGMWTQLSYLCYTCVNTTLSCLFVVFSVELPWDAALSGNPCTGLLTGGGTGGGGKFLSLTDSFGNVTYEDVFGCWTWTNHKDNYCNWQICSRFTITIDGFIYVFFCTKQMGQTEPCMAINCTPFLESEEVVPPSLFFVLSLSFPSFQFPSLHLLPPLYLWIKNKSLSPTCRLVVVFLHTEATTIAAETSSAKC